MAGSTTYAVGVHLTAKDEGVAASLSSITKLARELHAAVQHVIGDFPKMAAEARRPFEAMGQHFSALTERGAAASKALGESFAKFDSQLGRTGFQIARLRSDLDYLKRDAAEVGAIRMGGGGGAGHHPRPGQGGGHGGGDAGLALGIAGVIGVEAVGHGLSDVVKQASELRHVQEQMIQGGFRGREIAEALAASWKVSARYGIDVSKVMSDIRELRTPLGSTEHAIGFIDPLEKMRIVLNAVSEGSGNSSRDAIYKMARSGELKGLNDAGDYLKYFDAMTKVISATGGKVGPNDFLQATKYSRLAAMGYNQEFYTEYLPTLIQGLGASGAGTAGAALFGTLIQGKASGRSVKAMDGLGLIGDQSRIMRNKHGDTIGFNSGAIRDSDLLTRNPLEWVRKDLLPLLERKFGDLGVEANKMKAIDGLGDLFGSRMSAQAIGEMAFRMKSFDRDRKLLQGAKGLDGADRLLNADPVTVAEKLRGAWENLLKAVGGPLVDPAIAAMNAMAAGFTKITEWANAHPEAVKQVGAAVAGLAGGLAVLTAAGVVAAAGLLGPAGAIGLAIGTTVGALTGLAALNWDALSKGVKRLFDSLTSWFRSIQLPAAPGYHEGDNIGALPQASSGDRGGLFHPAAFGDDPASSPMSEAVKSGFVAAFREIMGGAGAASSDGGGLINASFTGSGFPGLGGGGGGGWNGFVGKIGGDARGAYKSLGAGGTPEAVAAIIRASAIRHGIDPNVAVAVARSEGLTGYVGDYGTSFGPFQLHYGGSGIRGMNSGGLGDAFTRATGLNARDPKSLQAQIDFAMEQVRKGGWSPWHGAAHIGIRGFRGVGALPSHYASAPTRGVAAPPSKGRDIVVHSKLHLDGKVAAKSVVTAMLHAGTGPDRGGPASDDSVANYGIGTAFGRMI